MRLTIVGCSGSVPGPDSGGSCYLVQAEHDGSVFSMLLDLGPGSFGALWSYLDPQDVSAIALSHLHPDHCLDLCAMYVGARYSPTAPWPRIPVYGPTGTPERLSRAYEVQDSAEEGPSIADHWDYRVWHLEQRIGPFTVSTARVAHPVEAYGMRIRERATGATLTYTGDTGPTAALASLARGADLLLAEAAFRDRPDNPPGVHLSGRDAAQVAAAAQVGRLVLTHIPPWQDLEQVLAEAKPHFPGPVELARAGANWTIGQSADHRRGE